MINYPLSSRLLLSLLLGNLGFFQLALLVLAAFVLLCFTDYVQLQKLLSVVLTVVVIVVAGALACRAELMRYFRLVTLALGDRVARSGSHSHILGQEILSRKIIVKVLDPHRVVTILTVTGLLGSTLLNNDLQLLGHQSANVLELLQQSGILV